VELTHLRLSASYTSLETPALDGEQFVTTSTTFSTIPFQVQVLHYASWITLQGTTDAPYTFNQ
jgi:hypothetical protein